jgi:CheY-like chemotaxis protein
LPRILTSNNAQVFRQLGSRPFRGAPIEHEVAASGAAILERARRAKPSFVILDGLLPDGSGFDVCRQIKEDPELAGVRVMMLLDNPATQEQLSLAESSRCDDILCLPAPPGELYGHLASVLGFPEADSRRVQEKLIAELDLGKGGKVRGEVLDLAETGARVRIAERIAPPPKVHVRMSRAITDASHELEASVIWQRQQPGGEWEAGLKHAAVDPAVLGRLRASCLWDKTATDEGVLVSFRGDFVESVDFSLLQSELAHERAIEFELSRVRRLNSVGACRWAELVHALPGKKLSFLRCSLEFTSHAAMTTGMLGDGHIESLAAPYACESCGANEVRLLQVATLWDGDRLRPPILRCSACGGELLFDDIPERYFSFLSS